MVGILLSAFALAGPTLASAHDAGAAAVGVDGDSPAVADGRPLSDRAQAADFGGEIASDDARRVADWVVVSHDNQGLAFAIIDKVQAKVFVFESDGRLRGATLALLGRARGDDSEPGIGTRRLATIRPEERTTPAGRFVAFLGRDFQHDVLWIDYDNSIALHRVITGDPGDHRLSRLATSSARDKRISYGCINVPAKFYDDIVLPTLGNGTSIVYILPEIKTIGEVFGISDVELPNRR